MTAFPILRFDRSVSDEFLAHFRPGGFASSLLEYAHARYPIDFQFRKDPKNQRQWATLYVGMTAVLNVKDKPGKGCFLTAHPTYTRSENRWDPDWDQPQHPSVWHKNWNEVEEYLERIIPTVMKGSLTSKEGPVQAAVSVYRGDPTRVVLDREVIPGFIDEPTRKRVISQFSDELVDAVNSAGIPGTPPTKFGPKCDLLAIHHSGHLEAIEVKPSNVSSLAWVPAQATMYAALLNYWIANDPQWEQTIARMFAQRAALGLVPPEFTLPVLKPHVTPAVAFQRTAEGEYVDRMFSVQRHLSSTPAGNRGLVFYRASLSGRLVEDTR